MIANERQYRISSSWLARFEQARADVENQDDTLHPRARQALLDQYDSQIEELRAQLEEYSALRRGEVDVLELDSLRSLPEALIRARAAAGLSQEALAARLGLKKQQVQRWEATRYAGVDLERLQTVVDALGARISEQVVLPVHDTATFSAGERVPPGEYIRIDVWSDRIIQIVLNDFLPASLDGRVATYRSLPKKYESTALNPSRQTDPRTRAPEPPAIRRPS